jgi:hypothetical protein
MIVADAPAAHSMDTDWYGVDVDGNVARLSSGETGVVPYGAHREVWDRIYERIAAARIDAWSPPGPHSGVAVLRGVLATATDPAERGIVRAIVDGDERSRAIYADYLEHHGRLPARKVYRLERALRELDPDQLPHEWSGVLRFAHPDYRALFCSEHAYARWQRLDDLAVYGEAVQQHAFAEYWRDGAIATAYVFGAPARPRDTGFFEYVCPFSGDYDFDAQPAEPLTLAQLPEPLRTEIGRLRLPVRFGRDLEIDPQRWFECQVY